MPVKQQIFVRSNKNSAAIVPAANDDYFQEIGKEIGLDFKHSIGDNDSPIL